MAAIVQIVQSIPPGVNPYSYVAKALVDVVLPSTGSELTVMLWINAALLLLALAFASIVLYAKIKNGETWWMKRRDTIMGRLWVPNSSYIFTVVSEIRST